MQRSVTSARSQRNVAALLFGLLVLPFITAVTARAEDIAYPSTIYVVNVKDAPYNAKGDGVTDDTAAIQAAIIAAMNNRVLLYIPNGTYIVSNTLKANDPNSSDNEGWKAYLSVQGQSQAGTIIKLKDNCSGFTNAATPKAVFKNASNDTWGNYTDGAGNEAFANYLKNLTVDTGSGNVGAIGVDFQGSNAAAVRDVTIKSSDASYRGITGLSLDRRDNGPALIKNVTVNGFNYGVSLNQEIAHATFEYLTLKNQKNVGLWVDGIAAVRKLTSANTVPAVEVHNNGLLNLLDGTLSSGASGSSAIKLVDSESRALLRDVSASGYARVVNNRGTNVSGTSLTDWTSDAVNSEFTSPTTTLRLSVEETPTFWDSNFSNWAIVTDYGATLNTSSDDDSAAIQAAMNSGKPVVCFPSGGSYAINTTITVPASVKLILLVGTSGIYGKGNYLSPIFKFQGGTANDTTVVDGLILDGANSTCFGHADKRTLVLKDVLTFTKTAYANNVGGGKLFIENVTCGGWYFGNYDPDSGLPMQVWARQWNIEGDFSPKSDLYNGTTVWALGVKSEGGYSMIGVRPGGKLELFGGFMYSFGVNANEPLLTNEEGNLSASFATIAYSNGPFDLLVNDTRSGTTQEFRDSEALGRGWGAVVPLYVSRTTNLLTNPGFDSTGAAGQTVAGWSEWSGVGGVNSGYFEAGGSAPPHSGAINGAHWNSVPYNMYTFQVKTGLANGLYTARAWVRSSGGLAHAIFLAKNFGGTEKNSTIPTSNTTWKLVTITNINVTNGQCEIGFWSDDVSSGGGHWIAFDDVEFFKQ